MSTEGFFGQPTPRSSVKAEIVSEYFWSWATVMRKEAVRRRVRLRYLDLYAGTGCYDDGTPSTPLLVLSKAITDPKFRDLVSTHFNDVDQQTIARLRSAVAALDGIKTLPDPPVFSVRAVDSDMTAMFEAQTPFPPTFSFVDPFGYKGLSVRLIRALTSHWGSDCIFFFNYNRVNPGLTNPLVRDHMNDLFGTERAERLRSQLQGVGPEVREQAIVHEIRDAICEGGDRRSYTFKFKSTSADRTSHYLVFVSKKDTGIRIVRSILSKFSSERNQGVPTYEFNPRRAEPAVDAPMQMTFLLKSGPLDSLQ